ncbi:maleylpyruvate isomerase family mycothiol-dependent enzyme [Nocardioides sp. zg-1308]|uniref:maleylpyruvate isomerase family mycothiol-dependent enzyme n=1 Tax=Nocardioides sp. zg-1308 TaxID=2736253 RepID=UPI001556278A|nr:maleylpyruvate isomerase family mycothiol-dependent enzyme [Nocardioides sp. zg-1308]
MIDVPRPSPDLLVDADRALVRTVDQLSDSQYAEPSQLPGWSRAHVVAHLALNAEALAGVLHGAHLGQPRPMYASPEARDTDIEALAAADPGEVRERFLASQGQFRQALEAMTEGDWDGRFERTPGGPSFGLANVAPMRLREVEVHHADLGAGYAAADWPEGFRRLLLDSMAKRPFPAPFDVRATDLDGTWHLGRAGDQRGDQRDGAVVPVVTGTSSDLGWWLTGRGAGQGLTTDADQLPEVHPW